ncbi:hypothetical protein GCM10007350_27730 [Jeongeupia chitinilytica]|uniref:Uncharacterized protein n=1 Tax=Jeongeupia chitinilytica TaxID=1041641 RepID=A0ABQ3H1T5_9NEIS|nr:hypothetical protein GCM10007350_27730 [Jeongeupia chitinilytica]
MPNKPRFLPAITTVLGIPVQRPYDWSNRGNITPEELITCVFESSIFQDLINVTLAYGWEKVRAQATATLDAGWLPLYAQSQLKANLALIDKHYELVASVHMPHKTPH